jgi:hypothetical protein
MTAKAVSVSDIGQLAQEGHDQRTGFVYLGMARGGGGSTT